jgi:hypothetical protein
MAAQRWKWLKQFSSRRIKINDKSKFKILVAGFSYLGQINIACFKKILSFGSKYF